MRPKESELKVAAADHEMMKELQRHCLRLWRLPLPEWAAPRCSWSAPSWRARLGVRRCFLHGRMWTRTPAAQGGRTAGRRRNDQLRQRAQEQQEEEENSNARSARKAEQ